MQLKTLTVKGYKSIENLEAFEFRNLNLLIGANGAGKSNLIGVFRMLAALPQGKFEKFVEIQGGPDALLFGGRKRTPKMELGFTAEQIIYSIILEPTLDNRLSISDAAPMSVNETVHFKWPSVHEDLTRRLLSNDNAYALETLLGWRVYHFLDTSDTARVKQWLPSNDNLLLQSDASNLAAYLARLKTEKRASYEQIVAAVRLAAPFFDDFVIRDPLPPTVELEWTERGDPETPHRAHMLSDGTLRFMCLATLLLQPAEFLPDTILIDEPELGLHPYAINLLAEMIKQAAVTKQVIISTQSVELLDNFEPEDVIIVDRVNGASTFRRPERSELTDWLEDYTLGELWKRNVLGGRPKFEAVSK